MFLFIEFKNRQENLDGFFFIAWVFYSMGANGQK
jgi:hypothetical protein